MLTASPILLTCIALILESSIAFGTVAFCFGRIKGQWLLRLVSFAAGVLLANAFIHLLPEAFEEGSLASEKIFAGVLLGIIASFVLEKIIHWRHCHDDHCDMHRATGTMMMIGDAVHNTFDGVLIAGSFLADPMLGVITTLAVLAHELPQELGDAAVLLHSGFTRKAALSWNLLTSLTSFLGAGLVFALADSAPVFIAMLIPLTVGNFLYIAGVDLLPTLHKEKSAREGMIQFVWMLLGVVLIYAVGFLE